MSYVGGSFSHDVFVSYSHGAARVMGSSRLAGWSRKLVEDLEIELLDIDPDFQEAFDLFVDQELDPTLGLTSQLKSKVRSSALLLVVMSPHYLRSAWCQDELSWFETEVQYREQNEGCVLVVRALPTEHEEWPGCLKDERGHVVLGFRFHPQPTSSSTRPYGWPVPQVADRSYFEALSSLAGTVQQRLKQVREYQRLRVQSTGPGLDAENGLRLYLRAQVEDQQAWTHARTDLEGAGFEVLPESAPQPVGATLRAISTDRGRRLRAYKTADVLLILRSRPGDWIVDEIEATGHGERTEVKALFEKDLPCAVIDQVGDPLPVAEELGITVIPATGDAWPTFLRGWLLDQANGWGGQSG